MTVPLTLHVKRKNQNQSYRARAVTLIIVSRNIYQIFRPITLLRPINILHKVIV